MQSDDPKYLRRKVKSGAIDVHPTEKALVVNYELEAVILGDQGGTIHGDKKQCQKIIRLKALNSRTDCLALAKEVVEKCNLIHPTKLNEVQQLIGYLKNRKNSLKPQNSLPFTNNKISSPTENVTSIKDIDEYVEFLYEDLPEKIKGASLILELAKNPDNLEEMSKNEAALSALTRVLREDWKKSVDLSINIVGTLFYFSSYEDFHSVIIHYKIGSLCMNLIEQEIQRYDEWKDELQTLAKESPMTDSMIRRSKIPEPKTRRPKTSIISENTLLRTKMVSSSSINSNMSDSGYQDLDEAGKSVDKQRKQLKILMRKQDQLLRILIYLLLNISQDVNIEEKMVNKNIVELLTKILSRNNVELLTLVVTFLKKMSIYETNKNEMIELNLPAKLPRLLSFDDAELVHVTLKLMFNMSFDATLRAQMIDADLFPKFIELLSDDKHKGVVLKILYHLSLEKPVRAMFATTDIVDLIIDMLILSHDIDLELIAVCVNLARDPDCAEQILEKNSGPDLITRAMRTKHALLMKMIRNISRHTYAREFFLDFVPEISQGMIDADEDFAIECIGTMSNLNLPEIDFQKVFEQLNLVKFIRSRLRDDNTEDDFKLECIILLGTAVQDESCSRYVCEQGLINDIIRFLNEKQTDDEIVLQIIYLFYQILSHITTREYLSNKTDAVAYIIDLMRDKNQIVRKWCNYCLDSVQQLGEDWEKRIRSEKFRAHNSDWLDIVENHDLDTLSFDEHDDERFSPIVMTNREKNSTVEMGPCGQRIALDLEIYDDKHIFKPNDDDSEINSERFLDAEEEPFTPYYTLDSITQQEIVK